MPDYGKYRAAVAITNKEMTDALHKSFPQFTKIQSAMVNAPAKYGVCLTPEAEKVLVELYGFAEGLNTKPTKPKPSAKRSKPKRLAVYLDDATYLKVKQEMKNKGYENNQDYLEDIISKEIGGK